MNGFNKALVFSVLAVCTTLFAPLLSAKEQLVDQVVAIVDANVVLESEMKAMLRRVRSTANETQQTLPADEVLKKQVLERLINESLQLQMASRMGVKIGDAQLEDSISSIIEKQNMNREQFLAKLQAEGTTYATYRENVRNEIIISQLRQAQVRRRINISDQEVEDLIKLIKEQGAKQEQYQVGHILIKVDSSANAQELEQASSKAVAIINALKEGADFHAMAISESAGPKALEGGNWGFMNINEMPSLFAEVLKGKNKGEVFGPLKTSSGFHIIKVLDTRGKQSVEKLEVNARHILIKPSIILSDNKAKSILEGFLKQIKAGEASFEALAKEHSEDPGSAIRGGALGWSSPDAYVPAFKEQVSKMQAGEISQPFRSTFGWHIIKLDERRVSDATETAIKNQAYELLYRRKFSEEAQAWVDELRDEAYVKIISEELQND